jgi:pimeloyl-ACP methyl ester carboxylesterase
MSEVYHHVQHQNAVLGYTKSGTGSENLLLFHGFGQDHSIFNTTIPTISERFTIYSFDLFFHGKSKWLLDETPLSKQRWTEIIGQFLDENKMSNFSLAGFSLGGKFVFATLEAFPAKIKSIFLLAPDGVKTSLWYSLATYPIALRSLFKSMILKPHRFGWVAKLANALGLVDKGIIRFAQAQMDTEEKRGRVYYSWVVFRLLKFDMAEIADLINSNKIRLTIIIGKFDKIITAKNMNGLTRLVNERELKILDSGHNGLVGQLGKIIGDHQK